MRASDRKLSEALALVGVHDLAARAAAGEWNEYFGPHADGPITDLIATLKQRVATETCRACRDRIEHLIERTKAGDFDATQEEALEWSESDEGRAAFCSLQAP